MSHRRCAAVIMALLSLSSFIALGLPLSQSVATQALHETDREWFVSEFPRSYMANYHDKTFEIGCEIPILLGPDDSQQKIEWLAETAAEEFNDYVSSPQEGTKTLLLLYDDEPVGALLYRLRESENTIYLAQFFVVPERRKNGIGRHIITSVMPSLHPEYKRYELVARPQNEGAHTFYTKCGFERGDEALVRKYNYNQARYQSLLKLLQ